MNVRMFGKCSAAVSVALLLIAGLAGIAHGSVIIDRVVAVVNDQIITLSDLQREAALKKVNGKKDERLLLEDMIDRKLQMEAAKRIGMDVTDKELDDAVEDIMTRNNMDHDQFVKALSKEGLTFDQYKSELREQMTLSRLFNKYVRSDVSVDEAEVRAYYENNQKDFAMPEEIRISHILFKVPDHATPTQTAAVRRQAKDVYARAVKGEDFAGLVREFSDGNTADGGDLGFMRRDQVIPEIGAATRNLQPGGIAGPIKCAGGFQIIKLEEVRTPVKPFDKVKDEILKKLYEQKTENTYRTWIQSLRSDSHIENRL